MLEKSKLRADTQFLRGFAVGIVLIFHAFPKLLPSGYLGVDIFFVISGFVVTPMILEVFEGPHRNSIAPKLKRFYKKRYFRLAPSLASTIIFSIPLIFFLGNLNDHARFFKQGLSTLFLIGNIGAQNLSGDYFNPRPNPMLHTWSLSVEEQIYFLIPLGLLIFVTINKKTLIRVQARNFLFLVNILLFIVWIIFPTRDLFYSPQFRIVEFSMGAFAYFHLKNYSMSKFYRIPLLVIFFFTIFLDVIDSKITAGLIISFATAAILIFNPARTYNSPLIDSVIWVGNRSYSIYLVHMPIIYLANYSPFVEFQPGKIKLVLNFFAVTLSLLVGNWQYVLVEQKFRIHNDDSQSKKRSINIFGFTTLLPVVLLIIGLLCYENSYFGLKHSSPPPYAGLTLEKICGSKNLNSYGVCLLSKADIQNLIFLIGDSHAAHLSPALISIAEKRGWGFAYSDTANTKGINHFIAIGNSVHVVYSQYWHQELMDTYISNIEFIKAMKVDLVVIAQSPAFPDETLFMNQRSILNGLYRAPKSFSISNLNQAAILGGAKLVSYLENSGTAYIDPMPFFCTTDRCTRWSHKGWLYFDDDHFSRLGAMKMLKPLESSLSKY